MTIKVNIVDKYALALLLLCEVDGELTTDLCDEIIVEMIEAGESPLDINPLTCYPKKIH
jgi:hypothetical protein